MIRPRCLVFGHHIVEVPARGPGGVWIRSYLSCARCGRRLS